MGFPIAISFHRTPASEALRAEVMERTRQLERLLDDILACRVVIEADTRRLRQGRHYGVYVRIAMPCHEIEAGGKPIWDDRHADPHVTVADAFDDLRCRLDAFVRQRCLECRHYRGCYRCTGAFEGTL